MPIKPFIPTGAPTREEVIADRENRNPPSPWRGTREHGLFTIPDRDWIDDALCRSSRFRHLGWVADEPTSSQIYAQVDVCSFCPANEPCMKDALEDPYPIGVRAGIVFRADRRGRPSRLRCAVCRVDMHVRGAKAGVRVVCSKECHNRLTSLRNQGQAS